MSCPVMVGGGPYQTVTDAFNTHQNYADAAFQAMDQYVQDFMAALKDLQNLGITTTISWHDPGLGGPWRDPSLPASFTETFQVPEDIIDLDISDPSITGLVGYPSAPSKPGFDTSGLPSPWAGTIPSDIPEVDNVVLPTLVLDAFPSAPTLENIPLPILAPIEYPTFGGVLPNMEVAIPDLMTPPVEEMYSSDMLEALQNQIFSVLSGTRGYLDEVWDMVWTREMRNELDAANQAMESVLEQWAGRGWAAPGGVEAEQLLLMEQNINEKWSARAREIAIEQNKQEVERFNFHLSQGIALENSLIVFASQRAERALKAIEIMNSAMIAIFQAKVQLINIQLEGYKVQASVFRDLIQAELLKVQTYEAQIRAAALIGEIDERKIKIYLAQLEGIQKQISIYLGQMEGAKVELDMARLKIQAAVERINAAKAQLEAKKLEFDGYDSKIRGQMGIANIWQTEGQVFLAHTQAISARNNERIKVFEGEMEKSKLTMERIRTDLERFKTEYSGEAQRFDALVKKYGSDVVLYGEKVKGEVGRMGGEAEKYKALVERAKSEETLKLQQAEINLRTLMRIAELETSGLEKLMMTYAQIGSASLAAIHAAASISGSSSDQRTYSYSCD